MEQLPLEQERRPNRAGQPSSCFGARVITINIGNADVALVNPTALVSGRHLVGGHLGAVVLTAVCALALLGQVNASNGDHDVALAGSAGPIFLVLGVWAGLPPVTRAVAGSIPF